MMYSSHSWGEEGESALPLEGEGGQGELAAEFRAEQEHSVQQCTPCCRLQLLTVAQEVHVLGQGLVEVLRGIQRGPQPLRLGDEGPQPRVPLLEGPVGHGVGEQPCRSSFSKRLSRATVEVGPSTRPPLCEPHFLWVV